MDTTHPGNLNTGHEFRNLTLKEFEEKQGITWDGHSSIDERWARVLGTDPHALRSMSATERWKLTRDKSQTEFDKHRGRPISGLYRAEFSEEERWQLVEYLKSL